MLYHVHVLIYVLNYINTTYYIYIHFHEYKVCDVQ